MLLTAPAVNSLSVCMALTLLDRSPAYEVKTLFERLMTPSLAAKNTSATDFSVLASGQPKAPILSSLMEYAYHSAEFIPCITNSCITKTQWGDDTRQMLALADFGSMSRCSGAGARCNAKLKLRRYHRWQRLGLCDNWSVKHVRVARGTIYLVGKTGWPRQVSWYRSVGDLFTSNRRCMQPVDTRGKVCVLFGKTLTLAERLLSVTR